MFVIQRNEHLFKHWFLYGIFISIFLAFVYPQIGTNDGDRLTDRWRWKETKCCLLGPLKPEWTVKSFGTMFIFFLNGCSIRSEVNGLFNIFDINIIERSSRNCIEHFSNIEFIYLFKSFPSSSVRFSLHFSQQSIEHWHINIK